MARAAAARTCLGILAAALLAGATMLAGTPAESNPQPGLSLGPSGLPLPRFVSLKSSRVNLRIGPGINYAVDWMYLKSGLPIEIIQEYDNWRRVRDADGTEGWINQSLLSGQRTAVVAPWQRGRESTIPLRADANNSARVIAQVEPGVMGTLRTCNGDWCRMDIGGHTGWISQSSLWGAYPGETLSN